MVSQIYQIYPKLFPWYYPRLFLYLYIGMLILGWSGVAEVSCILHHRGVHWYWLPVGQGLLSFKQAMVEGECFYFFCFFTFIPVPLSSLSLSFICTISSIFIHPFEKRDVLCYGVWRPSIRQVWQGVVYLTSSGRPLILASSWARFAILLAGNGRGRMFLFLCFFTSIPVPLSSLSLSFISCTISSISIHQFEKWDVLCYGVWRPSIHP